MDRLDETRICFFLTKFSDGYSLGDMRHFYHLTIDRLGFDPTHCHFLQERYLPLFSNTRTISPEPHTLLNRCLNPLPRKSQATHSSPSDLPRTTICCKLEAQCIHRGNVAEHLLPGVTNNGSLELRSLIYIIHYITSS